MKTSISIVKTAETIQKNSSQNTIVACANTQAAHTVWAIVLSVRIAERGLSISSFNSINFSAFSSHSSVFAFREEIGVERRVASTSEHKNETINAVNK